jgi:lipoprotein-releasing system permease protein
MAYEYFVGLRYLRAKRRQAFISVITFISTASVALGVSALIIVLGVMTGFGEDLRDKILGTQSHIIIRARGGGLTDYEAIVSQVGRVEGVVAATPFIDAQAMISSPSRATGIGLRGIEPDSASSVINLKETLEEGDLAELNPLEDQQSETPGIIIGKELSRSLGVFYHDRVDLIVPQGHLTPMGVVPKMKKFRIVGIFDSGMYEYDSSLAYISLSEAQRLFNMPGRVSGIGAKTRDIYESGKVARTLGRELGAIYHVRDWMEMHKNLYSALKLEKLAMFVLLVIMYCVAAFNIVGTLIMMVNDKSRDIAILKSMGAKTRSIMKIFIIKGLTIGVMGTALGLLIGYLLGALQNTYQLVKLSGDVYYISVLPVKIQTTDAVLVAASAIGISLLATLYPSWQAARLDPAEALRYE